MNKTTIVYACLSVFLQPCAFFQNAFFLSLSFLLSCVGLWVLQVHAQTFIWIWILLASGGRWYQLGCVCEGVITVLFSLLPVLFSPLWFKQPPQEMGSVLFFWLQVFNTCFCRIGSVCRWENGAGVENPVPVLAPAGHGWFAWLRERAARSWQGCFFIQCLLAARAATRDCPEQVGEEPGTLWLPWALEEFKAMCCQSPLVFGEP